ncbi:hypothetical protein IQ266_05745 [filamentous cyanobacterium LEGE 11480]|uniref:Heterocyst differentiation related protein n=1 Tax=Romeriopsis navalis LEGE 11480 TaxID=2777977 RepID=A0A928VIJ7_9CYAN|nr:hypothetical protein [Romeriopsis navalis]MBE9029263.1 hypothetical protein [Romeriopsis navalis LEGE 11480]
MSDTTSFLGGAALAGLAAMIVLRGGINFGTPTISNPNGSLLPMPPSLPPTNGVQNFSPPNTLPVPSQLPTAMSPADRTYQDAKMRLEFDQLKAKIDQQQTQIRSQQSLIDNLTLQAKANNLVPPSPVPQMAPQAMAQRGNDQSIVSGLPWALGGVLLTFGGGIALVGMMSMFSKQGRPTRTVEYVHDDYPAYLSSRRRAQALPPRRTIRRVDLEDVE